MNEITSETITDFPYGPTLHGWDDEKVYFFDETGVEWCVSDYPELMARLTEICQGFFAQQAQARSEDEEQGELT